MAIDADLNAGLIDEEEAKRRRAEVARGSRLLRLDGRCQSKFVRGDAIAGILILFINIIGGLVDRRASSTTCRLAQAANNYILLAIGDGLVAQIPALVISIAAGLVVSRVGKRARRRQPAHEAAVLARRSVAVHHRRHPRRARPDPGHAAPRLPADRRRLASATAPGRCASASGAAANAAEAGAGAARRPNRRSHLGRPAAGRHARPRGRLPADPAGRQGAAGRAAARASRASARSSRRTSASCRRRCTSATTSSSSRTPTGITLKGVEIGERRGLPRHVAGDQPGRRGQPLPGTATQDPAFGLPALDRGQPARAAPDGRATRWSMRAPSSPPTSHT